jgi:4-amino-4-deoxy-L-arabinose transferase-like glycosyltransferase
MLPKRNLIILLLTALCLLAGLRTLPLMDRDEPRFASAGREMLNTGNFVVPYFNGVPRLAKPPVCYWWMVLNAKVAGLSEAAMRFHAVAATWLTALIILGFGRRMGASWSKAALAAAAWLAIFQVAIHGRLCTADMPMVMFVTLTQWAFWEILRGSGGKRWWWIAWLGMAGGFLAKGPIAWVVPLLSFLSLFIYQKKRGTVSPAWRSLGAITGSLLCLAVVAIWGIPALIQTHGQFFSEGIEKNVVQRGVGALNGRMFVPGVYYLITGPFSLMPWAFLIPGVLGLIRRGGFDVAFLAGWLIGPVLIFGFYATQLPHYILPGLPAFFLLAFCHPEGEVKITWVGKTLGGIYAGLFGIVALFAAFLAVKYHAVDHPLAQVCPWLAVIFGAYSIAAFLSAARQPWLACLVVALGSFAFEPAGRYMNEAHASVRVIEAMGPRPGKELTGWGYSEPSLVWYSKRNWNFDGGSIPKNGPVPDSVLMISGWRLDGKNLISLIQGKPLRPTNDRSAKLTKAGIDLEHHYTKRVSGWDPATSMWVELGIE